MSACSGCHLKTKGVMIRVSKVCWTCFFICCVPEIYGTGIFCLHLPYRTQLNVGKCTIDGSHG